MPKWLRKYSKTVFRDKSGSDTAQVPASATLTVYRQGATITTGDTVSSAETNVSLAVRDIGRIEVGDTLQRASDLVAGATSPTVTVDLITYPTTIRVDGGGLGDMVLVEDDRLVPTNAKPTLYDERTGVSTLGSLVTSGTTGLAECYVAERFVDVLISGSGLTSVMLEDEQSGDAGHVIKAGDFPTFQDALDAVPVGGGIVEFPPGTHDITSIAPLLPKAGTILRGSGWFGINESGTELPATNICTLYVSNDDTDILKFLNAGYCTVENMKILGPNTAGTQRGIYATWTGPATKEVSLTLRRVLVEKCGNDGIEIDNHYLTRFEDVHCFDNVANGLTINTQSGGLTNPHYVFSNCWFNGNGGYGSYIQELQNFTFDACSWQNNAGTNQLYLEGCSFGEFRGCNYEEIASGQVNLDAWYCGNVTWANCNFACASNPGSAAVGLQTEGCHHLKFDNLFFDKLNTSGNPDGIALRLLDDGGGQLTRYCEVGNIYTPNGDIIIISGTEGTDFIAIYVTITQQFADDTARDAIVDVANLNPAYLVKGQIIYVLSPTSPTNKLQYWDGSAWQNV